MKYVSLFSLLLILMAGTQAQAEIVMLKKSELHLNKQRKTHHRYTKQIEKLNQDSDTIAYRIMNRDKILASNQSNRGDNLVVKLIKK